MIAPSAFPAPATAAAVRKMDVEHDGIEQHQFRPRDQAERLRIGRDDLQRRAVPHDDHQQIVEVMGDAARQLAERIEALHLPHLSLVRLLLGDIDVQNAPVQNDTAAGPAEQAYRSLAAHNDLPGVAAIDLAIFAASRSVSRKNDVKLGVKPMCHSPGVLPTGSPARADVP
ncbi:hypothetical protein DFI02_10564 [Rhizobium sp. PP-F2F-G20b]|nr:hypothetical protein DFI02_10564 [Rhizobium sp. PP-F2F-G20b]